MKLRFWMIYAGLLLASSAVRHECAWAAHPSAHQQVFSLAKVGAPAGQVKMAYQDWRPSGKPAAPTVVLLHGSPVASSAMKRMVEALQDNFRVIVPDLPGMGRSQVRVPDYSIAAHAVYVGRLIDHLGVENVHVAGYSMGGGVAIALTGLEPKRVALLTLISGLGVQEQEMFGDYTLNHAVHGAQWVALWALDNLTPHFGLLDWFPLNTSYARNFYDSDQRPLRGLLAAWAGPALIVHGRDDGWVPLDTAQEHARLVPQSERVFMDGGHGLVFGDQAPEIAARLARFVDEVEAGRAMTREQASTERLAAALPVADPQAGAPWTGGRRTVMLGLLMVATLVSEDLACIAAGFLVATGKLTFGPAAAACFMKIFVGDLLLVLTGRWLGRTVLERWPLRGRISAGALARAERWFALRGGWMILAGRFMPGTRLPTYVAAGLLRLPWIKFTLWFALACAPWTPLLVGLAAVAGRAVLRLISVWSATVGWLAVAGLCLWLGVKLALQFVTWHGRRLFLGKWRRLTCWEFWPRWAVYPPVVIYCLWLALKHRGATVFTAANPGIAREADCWGSRKVRY